MSNRVYLTKSRFKLATECPAKLYYTGKTKEYADNKKNDEFLQSLSALRMGSFYELSILAETQRHLDALACDHELAKTLYVPDGSRRIFDSTEKLQGLNELSKDMDDLLKAVYSEHKQSYLLEERLSYMRDAVKVLAV